jgi:Mg2+ and Co2+ transporter CorA
MHVQASVEVDPRAHPLLRKIARWFSEPIMGLLALILLAIALVPVVFDVADEVERNLDHVEWAIVSLFAVEYALKLYLSPSKKEFVLAPAHLLDLAIILLPFATLLPASPEALRGSPVLRLVRFARLAVLGMRTTGVVVTRPRARAAEAARPPFEIMGLIASDPGKLRRVSWDEFLAELSAPDEDWFYISGVYPEDFGRISQALRLPAGFLWSKLIDGSYPRIDVLEGYLTVFVHYPRVVKVEDSPWGLEIDRTGTLIVGSAQNLVTLAREPRGLHERMTEVLQDVDPNVPFLVRIMYALLRHLLERYGEVIEALEREVGRLENLPATESSQSFLEGSFHLKRQIVAVSGNLWHFKEMVRALAEKRIPLRGFDAAKHQVMFDVLADDADYRYETATNVRESLISLIELHLNVVSFEMNKVMRILAIVTTVALVPSVVGGLFGMNLSGIPSVPFWNIVFGVGVGMTVCLYIFATKGWLR